MFSIRQKLNNLINVAREGTSAFFYSYFFPVIIALVSLLFWVADLQMIGVSIVVAFACFVFVVYDDFLPIIPFVFIIPMCFRDANLALSSYRTLTIVLCSLLIISLIFHLVKYSIKITFDYYFYVLLGVVGVFLLGGIFAGNFNNYFESVDVFVISAMVPLAIHVFFFNKIKLNDKIDYRKYFCFCFICAITLASIQLCYAYFYNKVIEKWPLGSLPGGFCWANSNHIANLILLAVPLCCYMMISSKYNLFWFIELVFLYLTTYFSGSHGGLATLLTFTPFLMYILYQNSYKRNHSFLRWAFFISTISAVVTLAYFYLFSYDELFDFIITSASSNGRTLLYYSALDFFAEHPIFGVGFGNGKVLLQAIEKLKNNTLFHSTFFQILACAGAIGVIFYCIYYIARIKYLAKNQSILGKFALVSLFMFAVYGAIENSEFNIVLTFMATIITVVGLFNEKGNDDKPLPLYIKNPKF